MRLKILFLLVCSVLLTGCNKPYTRLYLVQHPNILQKENIRCQNESSDNCNFIKKTMAQFVMLTDLQREDAEGFGQQIIKAQIELANLKEAVEEAREAVKKNKASAQDKLNQAEAAYDEQYEKIQVLLAIVAVTSSED